MKLIQRIFVLLTFVVILILSLLVVMLNPNIVNFDVLGLFFIKQSVGFLLLGSFVGGIIFTLLLTFIPNIILSWRNERLKKQIKN